MKQNLLRGAALALVLSLLGCDKADDETQRARVERDMKAWLVLKVLDFRSAADELQKAAPAPSGRGWDPHADAESIQRMRDAWGRAREAYEQVEGAVAPLFPESDTATDARYDDFLGALGPEGDVAPFDDQGVVGMHAIERILWADAIPNETLEFEQRLPGYRAAAFPGNESEARDFKDKLCTKLVADIERLVRDLEPLELDIAFAFRGLIDLTSEQREKVDRAATGREESRYAQSTLRDLRANRDGCLYAYRSFQPWLRARGHADLDDRVLLGFERLRVSYESIAGVAIPRPPTGWSSLQPRPEHAQTEFGKLFAVVSRETDDGRTDSLSGSLMDVADALALPRAVLR